MLTSQGAIQLLKMLKHRLCGTGAEADATVEHGETQWQAIALHAIARHPQGDVALLSELDGVIEQIAQALAELAGIAFEGIGQALIQFQVETQAFFHRPRPMLHAQAVEQATQAERRTARIELAGLQFGKGENVVDHAHHVAGRTAGGLLILAQLGIHRQGLHQLQRADHAIHRRAQFVGNGSEEFILQTVAVGQLAVQDFQVLPGAFEDALALRLHRIDPVRQGQRQQADLQGRADLAGVHGEEHIRQVTQHHQGVDDAAEQERAPGKDKVTSHPQAAAPGQNPDAEDQHGEQQRQHRGQPQGQAIAGDQRQQHHQQAGAHQQQQQPIGPGTVFAGVQKAAGKLTAKQARGADQKRRCRIGPPGVVGPEILDAGAVDRHLIEAKRGDIEDVIQVAGVAHAQVDKQVVHQHHQQHAVDDAQHIDARRLLFQVGHRRPQRHRYLHRTLALHPQVQALRLVGL